jgi:hypothetical protein
MSEIDPFAPIKPGERGGQFFRHFKDERTIHRALLPHPDDWESYFEHVVNGRAHSCVRRAGLCPGCTWQGYTAWDSDKPLTGEDLEKAQRASKKYVVPVIPYDLDGPQKPVWWKYGVKAVMDLEQELIQNPDDLTKVDIGILKSGKGLTTNYKVSVLHNRRHEIDTAAAYADLVGRQTVRDTLQSMFTEVWGQFPNPNPEPTAPFSKKEGDAPIPDEDPWASSAVAMGGDAGAFADGVPIPDEPPF